MKRTKFIAGALVLSMGLLGTGYAYWTDALSIETTVETGKLDVSMATDKNADYNYIPKDGELNNQPVYVGNEELKIESDENGFNLTVPNMHPGTYVSLDYTLNNNSTMPIMPKIDVKTTAAQGNDSLDVYIWEGTSEYKGFGNNLQEKLISALYQAHGKGMKPEDKEATFTLIIEALGDLDENTMAEKSTIQSYKVDFQWHQWNDPEAKPVAVPLN